MERLKVLIGMYKNIFMPTIFDRAYKLDKNAISSVSYKQLCDIALALEQYKNIPKHGPDRDYVNACAAELVETIKSNKENDDADLAQYSFELDDFLECECEYPLEVIAKMTPRQKINNWLIYHGIEGFTDDILDIVSGAYDINLNRD